MVCVSHHDSTSDKIILQQLFVMVVLKFKRETRSGAETRGEGGRVSEGDSSKTEEAKAVFCSVIG